MKGSQLVPATEEQSRSVAVEPVGTDLSPTVQVSLAKRIIHPKTNKVVCLAAQTTVPIADDELASVSDLALRLSDGTNVRLSMSFFDDSVSNGFNPTFKQHFGSTSKRSTNFRSNDVVHEGFVQEVRSSYDPDRYETHRAPDDSWRLWLVFAGICAVSLGSFFYFLPGEFQQSASRFEQSAAKILAALPKTATPTAVASPPLLHNGKAKLATQAKSATTDKTGKAAKNKSNTSKALGSNKGAASNKASVSSKNSGKSSRSNNRKSENNNGSYELASPETAWGKTSKSRYTSKNILVPPPPPTMAFPAAQMQMFNFAPYMVPDAMPPAAVKAVNKPKSSGALPPAPTAALTAPTPAPAPTPVKSQNVRYAEVSKSLKPAAASSRNIFTDNDDAPATTSSAITTSAPIPGSVQQSNQIPLERISLP